jgi:carbon monoxide dehydrogenase subunit G
MRQKRKASNATLQNAGLARRFFTYGLLLCVCGLTPIGYAAPLVPHATTSTDVAAPAPFIPAPKVTVSVVKNGDVFTVDATLEVAVAPVLVWDVLTDFDHMANIVTNLTSSRVESRAGNVWIVQQKGEAKFGLLSFPFESVREVRVEPIRRMLAKNISGTLKRMESELQIIPTASGTQVKYRAEMVPDSFFAKLFGLSFIHREFEEQFTAMANEMQKRQALSKVGF